MIASNSSYLHLVVDELMKTWPQNRTVNLVFHGHSVPAGYFATPFVDSFNAYPHLLHRALKERFPFAVINAIVTAVGGETSDLGAARFQEEVLGHRADLLTIDYALNDRKIGLFTAEKSHREMLEAALEKSWKVLLMGPSADKRCLYDHDDRRRLDAHNAQLKSLADEYNVGYVDILSLFDKEQKKGELDGFLSWHHHPNAAGHALIASELMKWFPIPAIRASRE